MPKFRRTDRINEQLKQEISLIVRDEVRDPRVGLATITAVVTSPELDHARVYVTSLGDETEREEIIEGLQSAAAFVRKQLSGRLHMRRVPELHFEADRVLAEALRIEELLRQALPPELRNQPLDAGGSAGAADSVDDDDSANAADSVDDENSIDAVDTDDADGADHSVDAHGSVGGDDDQADGSPDSVEREKE